jgi:hypothetical protein
MERTMCRAMSPGLAGDRARIPGTLGREGVAVVSG